MSDGWEALRSTGRRSVRVEGVEVAPGSRVVLSPRGQDIFDRALAGQVAIVESVEEDVEGGVHLTVTLEDDPGRDLGRLRFPGHRFFFAPQDVVPLPLDEEERPPPRVLVAGIGNMFLGDDGFGVEVARRLAQRELPRGVEVRDFGIRGMDLAYALGEGFDAAVFVDAAPRGEEPGTLSVIQPELDEDTVSLDTHAMDPVRVLRLSRELGPVPERVRVVACEPAHRMTGEEEDVVTELSPVVAAAVDEAVRLVTSVVQDLREEVRR